MEVVAGNKHKLILTMRQHKLHVEVLPLSQTQLTRQSNSNGLHLGNHEKKVFLGAVIETAVALHKTGPPNVQPVELPLIVGSHLTNCGTRY